MTHHFSCGVEAAKCYFGQKVVDENDYVLIPNAIDVERFIYNPEIRNKIRKENDLENKHVVGHVGRFMAQKNHTFLMDVFAEVLKIDSQAHLVLLGDGELMDEIKRKTTDLGISEHVTFVGNVGNANEWYQAFDCFVLPSIWEGLPVVGVEAQAADLPCVFSSAITREIHDSEMMKAPTNVSAHGRYNEVGRSCYYIAENKDGALKEIYKHSGKTKPRVQVIGLKAIKSAKLLDLSGDVKETNRFVEHLRFTVENDEGRTVQEYLLPNFVASCCKELGIDGIRYKSTGYKCCVLWKDDYFENVEGSREIIPY